jgi:ABC-type polysaccharide/polyol phosphate export permease
MAFEGKIMSDVARPMGVTIIGAFMVLSGIAAVIYAVIWFVRPDVTDGFGYVSNSLMLLTAVIYLVLAKGIFSGSSLARLVVVIFTVLELLDGVRHLIFVPGLRLIGVVQILVALVILGLLLSRKSAAFFART